MYWKSFYLLRETDVISFPKKEIEILLGSLRSSCCVPTIRNLVFSEFISS